MSQTSFISKSVNYSQTDLLKSKILLPLLSSYNNLILKQNIEDASTFCFDINTGVSNDYIIPNNNKKFYLLITNKSLLELSTTSNVSNIKNVNNKTKKYNILYFFPDQQSIDYYKMDKVICNTLHDRYLEIDEVFNDQFLLEGYLYYKDNKFEYLLTDILLKNDQVVNLSYELRYTMLNELVVNISRQVLKDLNNHISINLHPVFSMNNENLIKIFQDNFIYSTELCSIERISNFKKRRLYDAIKKEENSSKRITKGEYTDVYNVYNIQTNNYEGILYIKGIVESRFMKNLFNENGTEIIISCTYNTSFKKWQPITNTN